jgi:8-oxo-dGTP diphosphatase
MPALYGWRVCPRCGAELVVEDRRAECGSCGSVYYAHSTPAVSAFVVDDDRMLLARRAHAPDAGRWDIPGGFLEEGEPPLDGLRRELLEETGLTVEPRAFLGTYLDTYGNGPRAPSVLNLVWEARILEGRPTPADDVAALGWFDLDSPPPQDELAFEWVGRFLADVAAARASRSPG